MAVYKRSYEGYVGPLTPAWSRFLIIARHTYARVFDSKFMLTLLVLSFFPSLVAAVLIYIPHNVGAIKALEIRPDRILPVNNTFFVILMYWQGTIAWIMTSFIGPGLISADLRNNALPLYFCRAFSRAEYVLGKMSVLAILLSLITWFPLLLLFLLEAALEGWQWFASNLWIANAIFIGSWVWIATLCLLALAMSAWVKWKVAAATLLFGIFFVAAGFGVAINEVLHTSSGHLINLVYVVRTVWDGLFRIARTSGISVASAWTVLIATCAVCLFLLERKVRAYEVERS